jgi:long-chain acyl-CoA synthetase
MDKIIKKLGPLGNIEFDKLFLGQILSHFADGTVQFTLIAIVMSALPSAGKAMATLFFLFMLPQFLLSPFAGVVVDKFPRKMVLSLSALYRAGLVILVFFLLKSNLLPLNAIYASSFALGIGAAFFYTAKMATVTNVVESSELKFANAINSSIGAIALLLGAFMSNFFVTNFGGNNALLIVSGMYFASSIVLAFLKFKIPQKFNERVQGVLGDVKFAVNYLKSHKRAFYLIVMSICISFVAAAFSNTLNALITDYYKLGFSDLTYLRTLLGGGIILGMGVTIFLARFMRIPHLFALGFITLCIALITSPMCHSVQTAWVWLLPIGIANAVVTVMIDTILQKVTPDRVRGKIFGFQLTLTTMSFLAGTILIANLAGMINPLNIFKGLALIAFLPALSVLLFDKSFRYFLLKATLGQIFLALFKYKFEGVEHLPKKGKVILAGNHTGHLDPFIIQMATHRQLWFVTGTAAFNVPIVRKLLKYFNVIPLEFSKGVEALDHGIDKLKAGEAVVIFPEGKFTPDGKLCRFRRGVAVMAKAANAPIVPFVIQGGFETWGKKRMLPRIFGKIVIRFGQPITDLQIGSLGDEKEITKELQNQVQFMKSALERRAFYNISRKLHSNFLDLIQEKGDLYGPVKALAMKTKTGYEELSYIEISRQAKNFANYLIETTGIKHKDRIAILTESRPEFAVGMFASIQTGAITVPLDSKLTVSELTSILSDCSPRIIFTSSHYFETAKKVKDNVKSIERIFVLDDDEEIEGATKVSTIKSDISKDIGVPRTLDDTALIVYTSGTTGNPKGVMISFGNIYSQLRDFETLLKLNERHTLLSVLPLNHLLELNVGFFGMLYMGAKVVYLQSLSPKELTNAMKEKRITNMLVVPLLVKMLKSSVEKEIRKSPKGVQAAFDTMYKIAKYMPLKIRRTMFKSVIDGLGGKLECFVCGGAPLDPEVGEFFERIGIPVYQGYGLTETSPTISTNYPGHNKPGTVGLPLPSVSVKLADTGEILSIGPNVMQGYYGKPEMTAEVIDECGWFHTGDIGEIDKQGYIKITGRIKNMIVLSGGKKIFPEEVEAALEQSPLIKELCVMSLKIKSGNKAGTEEVGAVVVPCDELAKKSDEEIQKTVEAEIKTLCEAHLAPYKAPSAVVLHREDLPKTSTRKVKRKELEQWYEAQD